MKHFELGQMHKVDINEGFKEIKTAPERSSRSMSQEMEEQKRREAEKKRRKSIKLAMSLMIWIETMKLLTMILTTTKAKTLITGWTKKILEMILCCGSSISIRTELTT